MRYDLKNEPMNQKRKKVVNQLSNLKRMSISISEEMENKIVELRKTDEFCRCSYTEIIRRLLEEGVKVIEAEGE